MLGKGKNKQSLFSERFHASKICIVFAVYKVTSQYYEDNEPNRQYATVNLCFIRLNYFIIKAEKRRPHGVKTQINQVFITSTLFNDVVAFHLIGIH